MATTRIFFCLVLSAAAMRSAAAEEIARVDDDAHIEWLRRIDEARERYDAFASRVVADFDHAVETHAPREVARLDDPTLRRGDIVVTATGPMMFKGSSKSVYDLSDFEPVGEAHARRSEHRAALLDILRAPALGGR